MLSLRSAHGDINAGAAGHREIHHESANETSRRTWGRSLLSVAHRRRVQHAARRDRVGVGIVRDVCHLCIRSGFRRIFCRRVGRDFVRSAAASLRSHAIFFLSGDDRHASFRVSAAERELKWWPYWTLPELSLSKISYSGVSPHPSPHGNAWHLKTRF